MIKRPTVSVTIDTPMRGILNGVPCPVDHGYAALDDTVYEAYILGETVPQLNPFIGRVMATGTRSDGSKVLIVSNHRVIKPEIQLALKAHESNTEWKCYYEHSCGAVLCHNDNGIYKYFVIHGHGGHIGFTKGHMELGETIDEAVHRELREEANITKFSYVEDYRIESFGITPKGAYKTLTYFLAMFDPAENDIKLQEEEVVGYWLLPFEEAMQIVNTPLDRELLTKANALLNEIPAK